MADRTISYRFIGDFASLRAGLAAAGAQVNTFGTQLTALDAKGAKMRSGLSTIGSAAGKFGLVAAAGFALVVKSAADFDQAMSNVQAATHETAANMELLRAAALKAGADTAFSASEAASAIEALAKAGVSTQDVLHGGLSGALDLAAAGSLDVGQAAEIAATSMTQFKLSGQDVPHIADLLAAAAGKAQGEVTDMAAALNQGGLVAAQMGVSIEETTGTLAAFASAGLIGSDAGTSLKTMLLRLANPSAQAAKLMKDLGINAYDASGQFVGMAGIAGQLTEAFKGKTQAERDSALATIFGSDAIRAASILYQDGAAGIEDWTGKVDDSGYAAETAATKLDNLKGDLEQLGGSLETLFITSGEGSQSPLRWLVQGLTDTINAMTGLPGPVKTTSTALAGLAALFGAGIWTTGKIVSGIASTQTALQNLGMSAQRAEKTTRLAFKGIGAAAGLGLFVVGINNANKSVGTLETTLGGALAGFSVGGPWGAGIGAAVGLLAGLAHSADDTSGAVDAFTAALDRETGALTDSNRQLAIQALQKDGVFDAAQNLGLSLSTVTDAALGNADAIAAINDALSGYAEAADRVRRGGTPYDGTSIDTANDVIKVTDAISGQNDVVEKSAKAWKQNHEAAGGATEATRGMSKAADQAAPKIHTLSKALKEAYSANKSAAKGFYSLADAVEKPTLSLDDLLTRMHRQAAATANMAENIRKAIQNGVDPRALKQMFDELGTGGALALQQLVNRGKSGAKEFNAAWKETGHATDSLEASLDRLSRAIDRLSGKTAKPKLDLDDAAFNRKIDLGHHSVDNLGKQRATPKAELDGWQGVLKNSLTAGKAVDNLGKKHADPTATLQDHASGPLQHILGLLHLADGYHANSTVTTTYTVRRLGAESDPGPHPGPQAPDGTTADGGTIPKSGKPYADRYHYMLADGEEVISNRYGQADKWRPLLKAINSGLAGGGTAGRPTHPSPHGYVPGPRDWLNIADGVHRLGVTFDQWSPSFDQWQPKFDLSRKEELRIRKKHIQDLIDANQKERDAIKQRLDALKQERSAIMDGVSQLVAAGADLLGSGSSIITPNPSGGFDVAEGPATFASFSSALDTQFGTGGRLQHVLKVFKQKHLPGQLLSWLIQNGATITTLEDFANQSAADLQALGQQFKALQQFQHQLGGQAANAAGVTAAEKHQLALLAENRDEGRKLNKKLDDLNKDGPRKFAHENEKAFAHAMGSASRSASRKARTR